MTGALKRAYDDGAMEDTLDPVVLAARQVALDAARIANPALADRKRARMRVSPLAFLRGAAPLFYEILAARPALATGPDGQGWLTGDLHVENFGVYRPGALLTADGSDGDEAEPEAQRAVFDLNDFDDATIGPVRLDALRLATSLLLGSRDLGESGETRIALGRALLESHSAALAGSTDEPVEPACVQALLQRVRSRSRKALLDARTVVGPAGRRFQRGPRYADLSMSLLRGVALAFPRYIASLPAEARPPASTLEVVDAAYRVAGTGSLGCVRVAVLTRGKGGADGGFIFDLKEQGAPSANALFDGPALGSAARVRTAAQLMARNPPRMLGETELEHLPCLGRRLAPQEDHLDWAHVHQNDLEPLARRLGWLAGRAHHRSLTAPLGAPWTALERATLLDRAVTLAGLHEAVYLAYCAKLPPVAPT